MPRIIFSLRHGQNPHMRATGIPTMVFWVYQAGTRWVGQQLFQSRRAGDRDSDMRPYRRLSERYYRFNPDERATGIPTLSCGNKRRGCLVTIYVSIPTSGRQGFQPAKRLRCVMPRGSFNPDERATGIPTVNTHRLPSRLTTCFNPDERATGFRPVRAKASIPAASKVPVGFNPDERATGFRPDLIVV